MQEGHPLEINLLKVVRCLGNVLSPDELAKIHRELLRNVHQALALAKGHLRFAKAKQHPSHWRQKVSRGYYACYIASRAVRLAKTGAFSSDVEDHKKIGQLPENFPDREQWADFFTKFRADRNSADYDHAMRASSLEYSTKKYLAMAEDFLAEAAKYVTPGDRHAGKRRNPR